MKEGEARLTALHYGDENEVNIFVHGYRAISNAEEMKGLATQIMKIKPRGWVYLFHWGSGQWQFKSDIDYSKKVRLTLRTLARGIILPYVAPFKGLWTVLDFKRKERSAEELGKRLKRHISRIPEAKSCKINLIGHSLGARVIHHALQGDWSEYRINDVILLGGAADAECESWDACLKQIKGKVYNAYSRKDKVLSMTPDKRKRIGREPLLKGHKKVVNREYPSFGHTDYWKRLDYIVPRLWDKFKPSSKL
ncbi:MAG: DUF726 domain-containing protein [Gammaproteobacteria bacterium]|nr:DUF726 domain-containing protein [Gammaproteobacteria bacterium]